MIENNLILLEISTRMLLRELLTYISLFWIYHLLNQHTNGHWNHISYCLRDQSERQYQERTIDARTSLTNSKSPYMKAYVELY